MRIRGEYYREHCPWRAIGRPLSDASASAVQNLRNFNKFIDEMI